ncbi:MAG: ATP-binding protein [Bacteroidota bacterium]
MKNPFYVYGYKSSEYFCDRIEETKRLKDAIVNGRNIVLLAARRMGKTGLIQHLFHQKEVKSDMFVFYFDIMNTTSKEDFVNQFANAIVGTFSSTSKRLFNNILDYFKRFNPVVSFDPLSGVPSLELQINSDVQAKSSIIEVFNYLEKLNKPVCIAIDEFQQITNYEDQSFEAFLRSHIQHLKNVNFIFSGSQQHILTDMFHSYSRPFYMSSDFLKLERINKEEYAKFIVEKFEKSKKEIDINEVYKLLDWLDVYTYYVQNFFNKLWFISSKKVDEKAIDQAKQYIIDEHDFIYSNLSNLLTTVQYNLLKAIALEGKVEKPTSKAFIDKYKLGTTSTINSAVKTLIEKELVWKENGIYKVYDIFMQKWFEARFKV